MYFSPLPCYLIPLGPKYPPQHIILENHQPTFLPQCERSTFKHIQNNRQDYSSVYLNLYTWIANWKTKDCAQNESKYSLTSTYTTQK
jgi:hypothetical protein